MRPRQPSSGAPTAITEAPLPAASARAAHRPRHRHVGDIRFAIFMASVFVIAMFLTFRSEAASVAAPVHAGGTACAIATPAATSSRSQPGGDAQRLQANAVLLGLAGNGVHEASSARLGGAGCRMLPAVSPAPAQAAWRRQA